MPYATTTDHTPSHEWAQLKCTVYTPSLLAMDVIEANVAVTVFRAHFKVVANGVAENNTSTICCTTH